MEPQLSGDEQVSVVPAAAALHPSRVRSVAALAVAALAGVLAVAGEVNGDVDAPAGAVPQLATTGASFLLLGALVLVHQPRHPVGRLMTAAGAAAATTLVALTWGQFAAMAWLGQWLWFASFGLVSLAFLVFPDGHLPSRRWRPVAGVLSAATAVALIAFAAVAADEPRFLTDLGVGLSHWAQVLVYVGAAAAVVTVLGCLAAMLSLVVRWRTAGAETRRQLACLLAGGLVLVFGVLLATLGLTGADAVTAVAVPLGMSVAILRYRLYDLDLVVNRTIVWLVMTLLVVAGYVTIISLLGTLADDLTSQRAALVATVLVAVGFQPLHVRVQRAVNRFLFGDRDDPYAVMGRLGDVLERTADPTAVLPLLTSTIARSLQVPYVAVELDEREGPVLLAEHGRLATTTEAFDMVSHGRGVGRLLVARRTNGSRFTRRECRLLKELALQAAVAAETTTLIRELTASRERLVLAREEERRRIRRDLHDGLGPALAGMSMQARAASRLVPDDGRPAQLLAGLTTDLRDCMREVRALVDHLRPAALDRGLEAALRDECSRFADGRLTVTCTTEGALEDLPAAIEVAAYRIVAESLANVARHSGAARCEVTVRRGATLEIGIRDDGTGIAEDATGGVGLGSMRERAAEVGGRATVRSAPGRGTTVAVELPLRPGPGLDGGAAARRPQEVPEQRTRTAEDSWASRS